MDSFEWNKVFGALLLCALVVIAIDKAADIVMPEQQAAEEGQASAGQVVAGEPAPLVAEEPVAEEAAAVEEVETAAVETAADSGDSPTGEPDIAAVASETMVDSGATPAADTAAEETPAQEPEPVVVAALAAASADDGKKLFKDHKCVACHTVKKGGGRRVGPNLWDIVGAQIAAVEGFKYSDGMSGVGGAWDEAALDAWFADPKGFAPGNKMIFVGVKDATARANLIAYLKTLSD